MSHSVYKIKFHNRATNEFEKAYAWYDEQQKGLGEEFAYSVQNKLNKISTNPYHYHNLHKKYHEALIDRFPFIILFTVKEKSNGNSNHCYIPYQP